VSRALARRLAHAEAAADRRREAEVEARARGGSAAEALARRLDALAARLRASRGDGPLTPEEEAGCSIATLLAWWPGISPAAEARLRAFLADFRDRHRGDTAGPPG
jgi:hypothetical protein